MLLVTGMRAHRSNLVALCLGALIVIGCTADEELEGDRVPSCTDELGCPEGTRCVDGQMCVAIDGAEPPPAPPVQPGATPPSPTTSPGLPGAPPFQGDAGDQLLDAGQDLGPIDGGPLECDPGQLACETGCVDTTSDRRNCGGCGIDCGPAGECVAGTCQRERGPDLPPGNPPFGI